MTNETTAIQPILMGYVATDLDGHADVGLTIESAKNRAGPGCDTIIALHDISAQFVELEGKRVCEPGDVLASQPKSIGDDAQFNDLLFAYLNVGTTRQQHDVYSKIIAHIDSRAPAAQASATIQAAPDVGVLTEQSEAWLAVCEALNNAAPGWQSVAKTGMASAVETIRRLAATIQEPVMVAEPVGEGQAQTSAAFPLMRAAFETSESGPDGYFIKFKFPTLVAMQKAHIEWIAAQLTDSTLAAPMVADPAGVAVPDRISQKWLLEVAQDAGFAVSLNGEIVAPAPNHDVAPYLRRMLRALAATVKAVPSEALGEAPIECWSADQEDFIAQSIGELCDRNDELKPGDTVWVGKAVKPDPIELIDADDIVTMMGERADDLVGEHADGYPDVDKQAEEELNTLLAGWIGRHARPTFWTITNVKPYVLSTDDFGAPLADKTGGGE